jgi:hypothetical protein
LAREQAIDDASKYLADISQKRREASADPAHKELNESVMILVQALGRWEADRGKQASETLPLQVNEQVQQRPAVLLLSWHDILHALERKNHRRERDRVRRLNIMTDGPIKLPGQGGQPTVDRDKLLAWWNDLEKHFQESEQKQVDTHATLQVQHNHGREGTVLPGIAGQVKKRRGKGQGRDHET